MGASFGGGSSQTVFGSDGPLPLLNKVTTVGAIVFMITSVALAYNSAHVSKGSVMKGIRSAPISQPAAKSAPVEVPLPAADQASKGDTSNPFPDNAMSSSHNKDKKSVQNSTDKVPPTDKEPSPDKKN